MTFPAAVREVAFILTFHNEFKHRKQNLCCICNFLGHVIIKFMENTFENRTTVIIIILITFYDNQTSPLLLYNTVAFGKHSLCYLGPKL